ncbi:hypothetical protein Bbelb_291670 [Branchiostoma belcheri]|nr:hypothetical protein Bbelb_291670 [Branchiostoma belcheri]
MATASPTPQKDADRIFKLFQLPETSTNLKQDQKYLMEKAKADDVQREKMAQKTMASNARERVSEAVEKEGCHVNESQHVFLQSILKSADQNTQFQDNTAQQFLYQQQPEQSQHHDARTMWRHPLMRNLFEHCSDIETPTGPIFELDLGILNASRESVSDPGQTPEHTDAPTLISTFPSLIFTMSTWLTLHQHLHVTDAVWDVLQVPVDITIDLSIFFIRIETVSDTNDVGEFDTRLDIHELGDNLGARDLNQAIQLIQSRTSGHFAHTDSSWTICRFST